MATNFTLHPTQRQAAATPSPVATVPSATWRMLSTQVRTDPLPKNVDAMWDAARGFVMRFKHRTAHYLKKADAVLAHEKTYAEMTDGDLAAAAMEFRALFRTGRDEPTDLLKGFALIREVAHRERGEKHYKVQVAGGLAMIDGCIAEMATGEGKTLTAALAATVAGWRGKGCHVITTNDYLAGRDAEAMGKIYKFCGLTVGAINGEMEPPERRAAYHCDITYCTNKEVCADFLRDRLAQGRMRDVSAAILGRIAGNAYGQSGGGGTDRLVMRGLEFALIDEADSVLIDESVTPLIISGDAPNQEQVDAFQQAADVAARLVQGKDYSVNPRYREVELTDEGYDKVIDQTETLGGVWKGARRTEELVTQALSAREFFLKGKQYVVTQEEEGDKIVIVDEFTGRLMPDRTWREGLHQAIEAKEQITINPPKDTFARVSFQRFFRSYRKVCGMTGTGKESRRELWQIYHLPVVTIPTHRKSQRMVHEAQVFATEDAKYNAIVYEIVQLHAKGQPVLIGTRNVQNSERLSEMLKLKGLPHQVLNAVRHAEEAQIVAQAGGLGKITVATNMAGRGTDIKLGRDAKEAGGLAVIAAEHHESGRVDRQLVGRAARQGDPGRAQAFLSLEDELVLQHAPRLSAMARSFFGSAHGPIGNRAVRALFSRAQRKAQGLALHQRKSVLQADDWLEESLGFAGTE